MSLEVLKEGHRKALRVVDKLQSALEDVRHGKTAEAVAAIQGLLGFLEQEQQVHFRQEEEGLFLYLARITGEGPLQAMVGEHESYWRAVVSLKDLLGHPEDTSELDRLLEHLVTLLRGHIHKEETAYFPLAEERLSPQQLREVDDEMGVIGRLEGA